MTLNPRTRHVVQQALKIEEEEIERLEREIRRHKDKIFNAESELAEHRRQRYALNEALLEDE